MTARTEAAAATEAPVVIRLAGAACTYPGPPPVRALKPADLVIGRGEHVAITGPSGSGKSTLLNLVGLIDRPTAGTIEIDGLDVGGSPERRRAAVRALRIGFVFQSFHLLPHRTALENVMLAQVYTGIARGCRRAAAAAGQAGVDLREHDVLQRCPVRQQVERLEDKADPQGTDRGAAPLR